MSEPTDNPQSDPVAADKAQPRNPLHGLTLEAIVTELVAYYGWEQLGEQINIRCFTDDPSIKSSLKFLRKTPWAREKVESLYLYVQRKQSKKKEGPHGV
ncbi:VF530 family DNA-binding protein [Aeromonas molluscorum]|uniref:VF530 family protein n=1 Tax=Aeromonas molluscorum TaxID=271417 RepID=UPI003F1C8BDA